MNDRPDPRIVVVPMPIKYIRAGEKLMAEKLMAKRKSYTECNTEELRESAKWEVVHTIGFLIGFAISWLVIEILT